MLEELSCLISIIIMAGKNRLTRVCPGCHGRDLQIFCDGFGDGDVWFHCYTCGSEDCADFEDVTEYFSGNKPPTKSPPYSDDNPIPRNHDWPGAMCPGNIRSWMEQNKIKLDKNGVIIKK